VSGIRHAPSRANIGCVGYRDTKGRYDGGDRNLPALNPPNHTHSCSRCRGVFPCWELQCAISDEFICDDARDEETD